MTDRNLNWISRELTVWGWGVRDSENMVRSDNLKIQWVSGLEGVLEYVLVPYQMRYGWMYQEFDFYFIELKFSQKSICIWNWVQTVHLHTFSLAILAFPLSSWKLIGSYSWGIVVLCLPPDHKVSWIVALLSFKDESRYYRNKFIKWKAKLWIACFLIFWI